MMGTKVKVRVDKENKELIELHVSKSAIVKIGGASVIEEAQIVEKVKETQPPEPPKPVYEVTLGDVRFLLQSSEDLGKVIKSKSQYEKDLTTTEKFIKVVIAAQNKGKNNK